MSATRHITTPVLPSRYYGPRILKLGGLIGKRHSCERCGAVRLVDSCGGVQGFRRSPGKPRSGLKPCGCLFDALGAARKLGRSA